MQSNIMDHSRNETFALVVSLCSILHANNKDSGYSQNVYEVSDGCSKAKNPTLAFQEIGIRCKNNKATAVKIRRLSMPAQGQAIANFAVPKDPVTCKVGMPFSVPGKTAYPIKPRTKAASLAVVGTNS